MFRNALAILTRSSHCQLRSIVRMNTQSFDPPYLDSLKPKIPQYEALNVQFKGYDFALLESCQSLANKIASVLDINVEDGWATPATVAKVTKLKPASTVIDQEYLLTTYERNLQITDVPSTLAPIYFQLLETILPAGVSMTVVHHEDHHENIRYVPDRELKELKTQLDVLGGPVLKKK